MTKRKSGICDLYFLVTDSKTGEKIPTFDFGFPSARGNSLSGSVLRRDGNYGIFYVSSSDPVTVTVSAFGYSKHAVTLEPIYGVTVGPIPSPTEIRLEKE